MTKWLGAILVAGCGLWLGLQRTVWYTRRVETIRGILEALSFMERELKDRETPIPELIRRLEASSGSGLHLFFADCSRQLSELGERSFSSIWGSAVEHTHLPLNREEMVLFQNLGQVLGRYDQESQRRAIAQCETQLAVQLEMAREERDRLGRLSGLLGGAAGLMAVILMM